MRQDELTTAEVASLLGTSPLGLERDRQREELAPTTGCATSGRSAEAAEISLAIPAEARFTLQSLSEEFADRLRVRWTALAKRPVEILCGPIRGDAFATFILGLDHPTAFAVFAIPPLDGFAFCDIRPTLWGALFEQMLGGSTVTTPFPRRPLTTIELRLMKHLHDAVESALRETWVLVPDFEPRLERIEHNPRVVRCLRAGEPLLVVDLRITMSGLTDVVSFALPLRSVVRSIVMPERTAPGERP